MLKIKFFLYFVTLYVPRRATNFDFVGQSPIVTERICSVTLCDRFSVHMFWNVTPRNKRQTIGDRLTQCMKIKVENIELLIIVFAGVKNLALKLYSNSSCIFLKNGVFSVTEQERSASMGIWSTKLHFITLPGPESATIDKKHDFKHINLRLSMGPLYLIAIYLR